MRFTPAVQQQGIRALSAVQAHDPHSVESMLKLTLDCESSTEQLLVFSNPAERWMCNIGQVIHGGVLALLADEVMGCTANCLYPGFEIAPTTQMQLTYHRPVTLDAPIRLQVQLVSATRHFIHLRAVLPSSRGILFSAEATFYCR